METYQGGIFGAEFELKNRGRVEEIGWMFILEYIWINDQKFYADSLILHKSITYSKQFTFYEISHRILHVKCYN